jgi:hypothetical protein
MSYVTHILGHVASYGLKADDALRAIIERAADEFAVQMCRETGMKFDFLAGVKSRALARLATSTPREPGACRGRTKHGTQCKKRTLFEYCDVHRAQHTALETKKRRVEAYACGSSAKARTTCVIAPARFRFQ